MSIHYNALLSREERKARSTPKNLKRIQLFANKLDPRGVAELLSAVMNTSTETVNFHKDDSDAEHEGFDISFMMTCVLPPGSDGKCDRITLNLSNRGSVESAMERKELLSHILQKVYLFYNNLDNTRKTSSSKHLHPESSIMSEALPLRPLANINKLHDLSGPASLCVAVFDHYGIIGQLSPDFNTVVGSDGGSFSSGLVYASRMSEASSVFREFVVILLEQEQPRKIPTGGEIIHMFRNFFSVHREERKLGIRPKQKKQRKVPYLGSFDPFTLEECNKIAATIDSVRSTCYLETAAAKGSKDYPKALHACFKRTFKNLSTIRLFGKLVGLEFLQIAAIVGVLPVEMVQFAIIPKDGPLYDMLLKESPRLKQVKWDEYSDHLLKTISYHLGVTMLEAENGLCECFRISPAYDDIYPGQPIPFWDSDRLRAYVHSSKSPIVLREPTVIHYKTRATAPPVPKVEEHIVPSSIVTSHPQPFVFVRGAVVTDMMPRVASMFPLYSAWVLAHNPSADQKFLIRSMQAAARAIQGRTTDLSVHPPDAKGPRPTGWRYAIQPGHGIFRHHTPFSHGECIDAFGSLVHFRGKRTVYFIKQKHAQQHFYLTVILRPDSRKIFFDLIVPHIFGLPLMDKEDKRQQLPGRVLFVRAGKNMGYCACFQKLPGGHMQIDVLDPSGRQRGQSIVVKKPDSP